MEFEDRFGPLPEQVRNLIYQIRVKLLAANAGLASVGFEGRQLVLRYPPLPEGVKSRKLREFPRPVMVGKNGYRIQFTNPDEEPWPEELLRFLMKIQ